MNKKFFVPALVAALFSASVAAFAQDHDHRDDRNSYSQRGDRNGYAQRDERNGYAQHDERNGYSQRDERNRGDQRWHSDRRDERRADRQEGGWGRGSDFNSGYDGWGPEHDLHRGQRLPERYRDHVYVVDHWRAHHLSRPRRGQHWVQVGADYVLVSAATGLIVSAVTGQ